MIGSYFKKLAKQNNMKIKSGVAYGDFRGYAVTFRDGSGTKYIDIATRFPSPDDAFGLREELSRIDLLKEYSIQELKFYDEHIGIVFLDTFSTWKKLLGFIDYFFPLLEKYNASKSDICHECGQPLDHGSWVLVNGVAYHLHPVCTESAKMRTERELLRKKEKAGGSFLTGALGALAGAIIGAVPIAVLRYFGHTAYYLGILVGFLAYLGYKLSRGKDDRGKALIVIACSVIGITLGIFASDAIYMLIAVKHGQLSPMTGKDVLPGIFYLLSTNEEYASECNISIMLCFIMSVLGLAPIFSGGRRKKLEIKTLE